MSWSVVAIRRPPLSPLIPQRDKVNRAEKENRAALRKIAELNAERRRLKEDLAEANSVSSPPSLVFEYPANAVPSAL